MKRTKRLVLFGAHLTPKTVINIGLSSLIVVLLIGVAAFLNSKGRNPFNFGADVTNPPQSISNQATVSHCTEGEATSVCDPAAGRYSVTNLSNQVVTTIQAPVPPPPPPPPADTTAPSAPTDLTATAISTTQINLAWSASTDDVGVTGYRVETCVGSSCTNFAQIGTPTGTTYNHTGLPANTAYRYRVRATDAAGNLSGYSPIANATTQTGTVPPPPPPPPAPPPAPPPPPPAPPPQPPITQEVCIKIALTSKPVITIKIIAPNGTTIVDKTFASDASGQIKIPISQLPGLAGGIDYKIVIKPRGYLARVLSARDLVGRCVELGTNKPFIAGDLTGDDNKITLGDIVAAIRAYNGTLDATATDVYGGRPAFSKLIDIIRAFNTTPTGES